MSAIHSNQVSLASSTFSFSLDKSNQNLNAPILMNNQMTVQKCNHSVNNDNKQTEFFSFKTNCKKAFIGSRMLLNTNGSKVNESKSTGFTFSSVSSDIKNKRTLLPTPMCKPKEELKTFDNLIKVKTEIQNADFATATGRAESIKQEPSTSTGNNHSILNIPQKDQDVKMSVFNFTKPKVEICESFESKREQTQPVFIPVTWIKSEKATQNDLTPENIKNERNYVNDSNDNINNNEKCGVSRIKLDSTVENGVSLNQTKMESSRSETEKRNDNLIQLFTRKNRMAISNSSGFAGQMNNSPATAVRRKIIFSTEEKNNLTKSDEKITGEMSNRLRSLFDVIATNSVRINTNFIFPNGCDGSVKPRCSTEETKIRRNKFEAKRRILRARRWGKGAQRSAKKMVISAGSIPEKICENWGVSTPSDKNTNLSVASYIRCRLSRFQAQGFRGRLEGEKISTLANIESGGRKRKLSVDNKSEFQLAKKCRLTLEDNIVNQGPKEKSILEFKKSCISKLEALEREWNEKTDLELEEANKDYRRELRQLQEQQSMETYTICVKNSNQVYNGLMENVSRRHWKAFRQMQSKFLIKTQNIEKNRHMQLAALRNEYKETGEHIQTILDASEMLSDYTRTPRPGNYTWNRSLNNRRRISIDEAVMLVKEDKIYDSFYTQEK